jgi:hypothetical protein
MEYKLGIYKHYKGNYYRVIGFGIHTETKEELVIYEKFDKNIKIENKSITYKIEKYKEVKNNKEIGKINNKFWIRPKKMFFEKINIDNKEIYRFEFVEY